MYSLRIKFYQTNSEWRTLMCFHVRTMALVIGLMNLAWYMGKMYFVMMKHEEKAMLEQASLLPTPMYNFDLNHHRAQQFQTYRDHDLHYSKLEFEVVELFGICVLVSMLFYGVIRNIPDFVLPFFCFRVFYFGIHALILFNNMCSDKSIVDIVHNEVSHTKDGRTLSKDEIASLILIIVMVFFIVQVYSLNVIWRCYKYILFKKSTFGDIVQYMVSNGANNTNGASNMLPDYETACSNSFKPNSPPSYQDVVTGKVVGTSVGQQTLNQAAPVQATVLSMTNDVSVSVSNTETDIDSSAQKADQSK